MNKIFKIVIPTVALLLNQNSVQGQLVGTDVFLKGNTCEVGISYEGFYGTDGAAPTGYHPRPDIGSVLGFVSDPALDGWTVGTPNYIGDYFVPGTPHEGWDIEIDGVWNLAWGMYGGFSAGLTSSPVTLTGTNTGYLIEGNKKIGIWEGTMMGDLQITQRTILDTTKTFFLIEVKLKNNGTTDLESVYYQRTVDPDNEVKLTSSYSTNNTVVYQPGESTDEGNKCLVTAIGNSYPSLSYMGLGTIDCRAKCYVLSSGLAPNIGTAWGGVGYPPSTIYNGTYGTANTDLGYNLNSDVGIGLVFNIGTIAAGDSTIVKYAYILRAEDLDSAFQALSPTLSVDDFGYGSGDIIDACVGDTINISVVGGEDFIWDTWLPSDGLLLPEGRHNEVLVGTDTITYFIIGQTAVCEMFDTIAITVRPINLPSPGTDSTVEMCGNADPVNLITHLGGTPTPGGVWTGPGVSSTGMFNPAGLSEGLYTFTYTYGISGCDTSAQVFVNIVNDVNLDFDFNIIKGCENDTVNFTNLSEDIVYHRWNFGDGTEHDTVTQNPVHIYEYQGEYGVWLIAKNDRGCIDSIQKLVNTLHPLDALFTQSSDSICQSEANTVYFYDNSVGNITNWFWDFGDGNTSDLQNPTHTYTTAGTYNIQLIITEDIGCTDTAYSTIFVDPTPSIKLAFDVDNICTGDQINMTATISDNVQNLIWNFGDGTIINDLNTHQSHSYPYSGVPYYVSVTSQHPVCDDIMVMDTVFVKDYPQINLGGDTGLCLKGAPIMIDPTIMVSNPPGTIYYWSTGDTAAVIKITEPGAYRIYANADGCITTDEVIVNKDCYTDIPNSFTPNNDGENDYFYPRQLLTDGVVDFKMTIYNRWGELVFETTNPEGRGWDGNFDGKEQPMGVYVYQISVVYKNSITEKYSGNVTLIR